MCEHFTQHQQQEQEQDHGHYDHVVTDAGADVQPAAVVADEEEKLLHVTDISARLYVSKQVRTFAPRQHSCRV